MKSIIVACLLLAAPTATALRTAYSGTADPTPSLASLGSYTFEAYVAAYGKTYDSAADRSRREAIFYENLALINAHNADPTKSYTMNINHMADWSRSEFKALMGHTPSARRGLHKRLGVYDRSAEPPLRKADLAALPKSVDWRNHTDGRSYVTAVKDQGFCGSCWAFAAVESMESHWALKTKAAQPIELSTQQVTECTPNPDQCGGSGGCQGATENLGYDYVIKNGGIVTEAQYPYRMTDGACNVPSPSALNRTAHFSSIYQVRSNDQDDLLNTIATKGPVSIGVWADPLQFYFGGVFDGCSYSGNMNVNHAIQLVGYGTDAASGKDYWIIRNSWGWLWGNAGYALLQRDAVPKCGMDRTPHDGSACKDDPNTPIEVCGQCGILFESSYAVPAGANATA